MYSFYEYMVTVGTEREFYTSCIKFTSPVCRLVGKLHPGAIFAIPGRLCGVVVWPAERGISKLWAPENGHASVF